MNAQYRFILEPYKSPKSRYHCPKCNRKEKTFARYIDTQTGNYVSDIVGRCNRENNCGYHYTPSQYFKENNIFFDTNNEKYAVRTQVRTIRRGTQSMLSTQQIEQTLSFIDKDIFLQSLTGYDRNTFTNYLTGLFGAQATSEVISHYQIGTSKHWQGATVFYQIDISGNIRAGKIMLYDHTGHRVKEPFNYVTWAHTVLKIENYELRQCLFGEHLLHGNTLPIAIVESEKTACICSIYLPQFLWLACGQLQGLNADKCRVLAGRTVLLFPDLKGFDKWQQKAKELQSLLPDVRFAVSDYLEKNATEADKAKGLDLADYLIKFEVSDFRRDIPAKPDRLKQLIEQGNTDAALNSSWGIDRQDSILAAGYPVEQYHAIATDSKVIPEPDKRYIPEYGDYFRSIETGAVQDYLNPETLKSIKAHYNPNAA